MRISITDETYHEVRFLKVVVNVRYWEDSVINGISDESGDLTPFNDDGCWCPIMDIDNGFILDWPKGINAKIHFKVCDSGRYYLLDGDKSVIAQIEDGYVPDGLCHGGEGYGDYIIMNIDSNGKIENYSNKINEDDWCDRDE